VTLDTGYKNTGATKSAITFLDGEKGILKYRGYSIEELAEKASFIEVAYLLIYGNLPTKAQLDAFTNSITKHTLVHEDMKQFFEAYPAKAHPMGVLSSMVCSLSTFYPESLDPNSLDEYYVYYQFTPFDTKKVARYKGQFLFRNETGILTLPLNQEIYINVTDSFIIDDSEFQSCYVVDYPCCFGGVIPLPIPTTTTTTMNLTTTTTMNLTTTTTMNLTTTTTMTQ
jgi:hypothetical protein